MDGSSFPALAPAARHVIPIVAAFAVAAGGLGYAVHEHRSAQSLAVQNAQVTAQLNATHSQLDALAARVNTLAAEAKPSPVGESPLPAVQQQRPSPIRRAAAHRPSAQELRLQKMQSQLDAQGKAIQDTRSDLTSATSQLGGSIARTHDELVSLERKGERNFYEFDIQKSKQFQREGPVSVRLKKANEKHQFADLLLIVDDRNLTQKHVNLYQPVMYYEPDSQQPVQVVINSITRNHIHGYVSAPKYRQSELAAMSGSAGSSAVANQAGSSNAAPALRQRLPLPGESPSQP